MKVAARRRVENEKERSPIGRMLRVGIRRDVVRRHMIKMFMYSAIKIRAKLPALYSTLKPETSSDSPSARSNGVRLVSAKMLMNHIRAIGERRIALGIIICCVVWIKSKEVAVARNTMRISDILISYEIVWAILRIAPSRAYFEFDAQPAARVV